MVKVFISWSGDQSRALAKALRDWLPQVIQEVEPWVSDEDIEKGKRWSAVLSDELEASSQGIICVTRDNHGRPWLNYEAGALSKHTRESSVRTLLFDIRPTDFSGPLADFQATIATDPADVLLLLESINANCTRPLATEVLQKIFERAWPDLAAEFDQIRKFARAKTSAPNRSQLDVVDEVLSRVRAIEKAVNSLQHSEGDADEPFPVGTRVKTPSGLSGEVLALGKKYLVQTSDGKLQVFNRPTSELKWNPFPDDPVATAPTIQDNDPWATPSKQSQGGGFGSTSGGFGGSSGGFGGDSGPLGNSGGFSDEPPF